MNTLRKIDAAQMTEISAVLMCVGLAFVAVAAPSVAANLELKSVALIAGLPTFVFVLGGFVWPSLRQDLARRIVGALVAVGCLAVIVVATNPQSLSAMVTPLLLGAPWIALLVTQCTESRALRIVAAIAAAAVTVGWAYVGLVAFFGR